MLTALLLQSLLAAPAASTPSTIAVYTRMASTGDFAKNVITRTLKSRLDATVVHLTQAEIDTCREPEATDVFWGCAWRRVQRSKPAALIFAYHEGPTLYLAWVSRRALEGTERLSLEALNERVRQARRPMLKLPALTRAEAMESLQERVVPLLRKTFR